MVYSRNNASVVLCGDLNTLPSLVGIENVAHLESVRHLSLTRSLGSRFVRADTGPHATWPGNGMDSIRTTGNILDHFFGADVEFREGSCLVDFPHTRDHHPIIVSVSPRVPRPDSSIKYRRLRIENDDMRMAYIDSVAVAMDELQASSSYLIGSADRNSSSHEKQQVVDGLEKGFHS